MIALAGLLGTQFGQVMLLRQPMFIQRRLHQGLLPFGKSSLINFYELLITLLVMPSFHQYRLEHGAFKDAIAG